jgi:DNA-binding CsgD family transcriptional regulator
MDFPIVGAVLVTEEVAKGPVFNYIGNRPPDFVSGADSQLVKIDPVVAQLRRSHRPFVYDQKFYVDAGAGALWEIASPYGYRTGISVAYRISSDSQLLIGLDRERDLPTDGERLERLLFNLERFAAHAANNVQRFVGTGHQPLGPVNLTLREREILLRVLEGKSNWVIAQLLSISENTVKFHLKGIFGRLNVSSRFVAATKAQAMGLL